MQRTIRFLLVLLMLCAMLIPTALATPRVPPTRADLIVMAVPGEYLVKFSPGLAQAERARVVTAIGGKVKGRIAALGVEILEFPALKHNPQAAERLLENLKQNPNVEYLEPNFIYSVNHTPNDPDLGLQWAWNKIEAYTGWDTTQGSATVIIAVVDTGVQPDHPDLSGKLVAGYDIVNSDPDPADGHGHGTHVAGTAAAMTDNGLGGAGACPACKLMPVRVLDDYGSGTAAGVAQGIIWAADNGATVINLSLGGTGSATLEAAVDYAWNKGAFLACAAGNGSTSMTDSAAPGAYEKCFAVAATNSNDEKASFSNYGTWVEAAAPGVDIWSTTKNSGYRLMSGTSAATPHVAGLAGLLASQGLSNQQIRDRILATADQIPGTGTYWTGGRINIRRAVTNDSAPPPSDPPPSDPPPEEPPPEEPPQEEPPSGDYMQNGGFESGTDPWLQYSKAGKALVSDYRPYTGTYSAWLGGYNYANDKIAQSVTIPTDGVLTYWWYLSTKEGTTKAYDYLRVKLYNSDGVLLATVKTRSNRDARNAWYQDTISLSSYAGQTVTIEFAVTTDSLVPSHFWVDDVSVRQP